MPSGSKMYFLKWVSSGSPLINSTMRPTQSMLVPYCQRSPGSNISGVRGSLNLSGAGTFSTALPYLIASASQSR